MPKKNRLWSKYALFSFIGASAVAGFGTWEWLTVRADKPSYIFATIVRGDIIDQVVTTGTITPVVSVDVGTQVSGTISDLYVDFNSEVHKGQILAKLDQALFLADVDQQEANVRTAEATLKDDQATLASDQAALEKAKVDVLDKQHKFKRQKQLYDDQLISDDDFDTARTALESSEADETAAEAVINSAQARIKADQARLVQARAALQTSRVNLEHTIIESPISGTVISRNVDRGQTVAASFSAPILFTIGQDLTKMQVNTNVDEADVGRLKAGMLAGFSVDAYPGETFSGTIREVRLSATTIQNVVTYDAVIDVPNPDLKLKPGMTANVKVVVEKAADVLRIPNSGLRFRPSYSDPQLQDAFQKAGEGNFFSIYKRSIQNIAQGGQSPAASGFSGGGRGTAAPSGTAGPPRSAGGSVNRAARGKKAPIWLMENDKSLRPVIVTLGLTDGVYTQIDEHKLKPGDQVVVGLEFDPNRPANQVRPGYFGGGMGAVRR